MSNYNDWGVSFGAIRFFEDALSNHNHVQSFERTKDIFFKISRKGKLSTVKALLVNEYTLGLAALLRARREFPELDCVVTCANWNAYTPDAKQYGVQNQIGVFVVGEFLGALWKSVPYKYVKKDEKGRPIYHYRSS